MPTLNATRKDQVTVEAETVEDALTEISTQLGEDAEIMRAQKVHRGGVGGFFAKEMVQLTARKRRDSVPLRPKTAGGGIAGVLERMAQDADAEDGDFRTVLRRELEAQPTDSDNFLSTVAWQGNEPDTTPIAEPPAPAALTDIAESVDRDVATEIDADEAPEPVAVGPVLQIAPSIPGVVEPTATKAEPTSIFETVPAIDEVELPAPVVPIDFPADPDFDEAASIEPVETAGIDDLTDRGAEVVDAPPGMGAVNWSTTALLRLGMPGPVISAVTDLDPIDDLEWIDQIASTVSPHCGPLPSEDVIVVGPHAERLAEPLGLPLVHSGDMAPYAGSFCAMVDDTADDRAWLEYVQGGRGIHLVIGDEPWQDLLVGEPVAVSWVGETAISDALYLAFTLGATLGYGTVDGFVSTMVRAQPTDVALAVRRIVGRR